MKQKWHCHNGLAVTANIRNSYVIQYWRDGANKPQNHSAVEKRAKKCQILQSRLLKGVLTLIQIWNESEQNQQIKFISGKCMD